MGGEDNLPVVRLWPGRVRPAHGLNVYSVRHDFILPRCTELVKWLCGTHSSPDRRPLIVTGARRGGWCCRARPVPEARARQPEDAATQGEPNTTAQARRARMHGSAGACGKRRDWPGGTDREQVQSRRTVPTAANHTKGLSFCSSDAATKSHGGMLRRRATNCGVDVERYARRTGTR